MEKQLIRAHFPAKRPCPNTWVDGAVMTLVQRRAKSEKEIPNNTLKTKGLNTDEQEEKREYGEKMLKDGRQFLKLPAMESVKEG